MTTLHIINGDVAADLLRRSHVSGDILPWRDALHEGPVPNVPFDDLGRIRVDFISQAGWSPRDQVEKMFGDRGRLMGEPGHEEIVLWFEHDLYDQLQLIQIIDWYSENWPRRFSLIEVGEFPGIAKFVGLGQLSPSQLASLFDVRREVTREMRILSQSAWAAFRSPNPRDLEAILRADTFSMPFLQDAVIRHLEEFPSTGNGLGRADHQLIDSAKGDRTLRHLFHSSQGREERAYMGDTIVRWRIRLLSEGPIPLLTGRSRRLSFDRDDASFWDQEVVLTPAGRAVADGKEDAVRLRGMDRWLGGVHLAGNESRWRWDRTARRLVERT